MTLKSITFKLPPDVVYRAQRSLKGFGMRTKLVKKALWWACDVMEVDHDGEFSRAILHDKVHPVEMVLVGIQVMQQEMDKKEEDAD